VPAAGERRNDGRFQNSLLFPCSQGIAVREGGRTPRPSAHRLSRAGALASRLSATHPPSTPLSRQPMPAPCVLTRPLLARPAVRAPLHAGRWFATSARQGAGAGESVSAGPRASRPPFAGPQFPENRKITGIFEISRHFALSTRSGTHFRCNSKRCGRFPVLHGKVIYYAGAGFHPPVTEGPHKRSALRSFSWER